MEKHYHIKKLNSTDFKYVVISKNYFSISDYLNEVRADLKDKFYQGIVLFDCLLSKGKSDRFLTAYFNGNSFDFNTFKSLESVNLDIHNVLDQVYSKNIEWVENNMILSNAQKFLLKRRLTTNPHIIAISKKKKQIH
jgi:hypothetical protein